ncbi:SusC/RagA family TonB-linked outer membrane protein [Niastella koreensis]|uniref:TonB-dependent receptor plug n=2 Tax=Niastella koreensis TaxID=354356 RepID=G8TEM2_NIAKG|nr:TonB-dependent receptor [Niastella koreensis]AEV99444.1 TonB-dependent receptor plug [Niastella koreensis GR20-10]OQP50043.1 SusC/RagA family TonB-linked outer membrane protein [Niastella koreensis]
MSKIDNKITGLPLCLIVLLLFITGNGFAQGTKTVTGTVKGAGGEPLSGINVTVKGTNTVTTTDAGGKFTIAVPGNKNVLVFSAIGYGTKEQTIGNSKTINITLVTEASNLNDVVVVGYGTKKKSDLTGAIASVSNETLVRGGNNNSMGAMQGAVAGVNIVRSNNKPGGSYSIDMRGLSSISSSNTPLIVVDGIQVTNMDMINPNDIEKIDILKDASATAIYGSRGANGVVIVTTKRGKTGKVKISYDNYVGMRQYTNVPKMMTGDEYVQLAREARRATNNNVYVPDDQIFTDPSELKAVQDHNYYDWIDAISSKALQTNHTVSAAGGTDDAKYALSGGYYYEDGMLKPQEYTRYNLRAVLDLKANEVLGFGGSVYFTHSIRETGNSDLLQDAFRMRPTQFPNSLVDGTSQWKYPSNGLFNPLITQNNEFNNTKGNTFLGNVYLRLTPVNGLELRSSFSPYVENYQVGQYRGVYTKALQGTAAGATSSLQKYTNTNWVLDNIATYKWARGIHNLDATAVYSLQKTQYENVQAASKDLTFNSLYYNIQGGTPTGQSSAYTQTNLTSCLGRINYTLMNKYLFTVSARYDGSSRLAEGHKWAMFPSAAVGWKIREENFLKDVKWLSDLKLRMSYGQTGNDAVKPYQTNGSISAPQYYSFGSDVIGNVPNNLRNDALSWETTKEYNLGVDFGLLNNRITGSVELYNRLTTNLIMSKLVPVTLGYTSITANVGSVRNKGVELTLNTVNVQTEHFRWNSTFTLAYNKNAIVDLAYKEDLGKYSNQLAGMTGDYANGWFIGQPIRVNWDLMTIGVWQLGQEAEAAQYGQKPGQFRVKDSDKDGVINNEKDRYLDGKRTPDYIGGFTNTFQYKNFDFAVHVYFRTGARERNQFYVSWALENNNGNFNNLKKDYWTPENPSNTMAQPSNMGPYRDQNSISKTVSHEMQSTDFVKAAYATLGYTFNKKLLDRLKISRFRIYATVQNPLIITPFSGYDPEQATVGPNTSDLMTRNLLLGLDISF